ncbi:MAG: hypothetical protein K0R89_2847, partial [Ramlibacter sp.]|nr:hypothetical protein [Ramlibacter sp.]
AGLAWLYAALEQTPLARRRGRSRK